MVKVTNSTKSVLGDRTNVKCSQQNITKQKNTQPSHSQPKSNQPTNSKQKSSQGCSNKQKNSQPSSTSKESNEKCSTDDEFEEPELFHKLKCPPNPRANKKTAEKHKEVQEVGKKAKQDGTANKIEDLTVDTETESDDDFEEVESYHKLSGSIPIKTKHDENLGEGTSAKQRTKLKEPPNDENDSFDEIESLPLQARKITGESSEEKKKTKKTYSKKSAKTKQEESISVAKNESCNEGESPNRKRSSPNKSTKGNKKAKDSPNLKAKPIEIPLSLGETYLFSNKRKRSPFHLLDVLSGVQSGQVSTSRLSASSLPPILEQVSKFTVYKCATPFDRRVTALDWHPTHPNILSAGSKGGDLILWNYECSVNNDNKGRDNFKAMIKGRGPGGSIQALKFDRNNDHRVYTASIDGKIALRDFGGNQFSKILLEFNMPDHNWNRWYTGLDVSFSGKVIVAGDNAGWVNLLAMDGQEVFKGRLHKDKCNSVQFSARESWMMVTTSVDHTVKIWDIRNLAGPESALATLHHDKAVNSAFFSPVSGDKLLTTDQHSQLRVYQAPWFDRCTIIPHPHRQFQHLTPIKAVWHSLADIPLAGRYPDPLFPGYQEGERRSIDFFNPNTGERVLELFQPGMEKIISLSQFSPDGSALLSGMGQSVLVWKQKPDWEVKYDESLSNLEGVKVEQWPGLRQGKKKTVRTKKVKTSEFQNVVKIYC